MEKHIQQYLTDIHNLLPSLIESYVNYYGEEHRNRVTEVINSITWIIKDNNANFLGTDNEQRASELQNEENFDQIRQNIKDSKACLISKHQPPIIAIEYTNPIDMHQLVHEINHSLHCKKVVDDRMPTMYSAFFTDLPQKYIYKEGIASTAEAPFFYEMINDYMTIDILNHHQKNYQIPNLNYEFDITNYIFIDIYLNNMIKDLYELKKYIIANYLINANGDLLKKELGEEDYNNLDKNLVELYKQAAGRMSNYIGEDSDLITKKDAVYQIKLLFMLDPNIQGLINGIGKSVDEIKKIVPNL